MAGFCPAQAPDVGLVQGLLGSVDCNVHFMVETGYGTLVQPNSPFAASLVLMLTLYIGFIGFRLLVGRAPLRVGELTMSALKIGAVLALATSWPTFQALVFDTLFRGPEQIAASMLDAVQPTGSSLRGNPFDGLQFAYDTLQQSAAYYSQHSLSIASPLQGGPAGAAFGVNAAALIMLMVSIGVVVAAKIVLGLLLALGPVFVVLLLFDATRGIFEGWLRATIALAIMPLLSMLSLIVQLILIEPHLQRLVEMRSQGVVDLAPANAILLLTLVYTAVALALVAATAIISTGLRLPWALSPNADPARSTTSAPAAPAQIAPSSWMGVVDQRPRAAAMAAAIANDRRESRDENWDEGSRRLNVVSNRDQGNRSLALLQAVPIGQAYRQSAGPRRAASNLRRDR